MIASCPPFQIWGRPVDRSPSAHGEGSGYRAELLVIECIQGVKPRLELGLRKEMNGLEQA
jgi:hypothetical protein